MKHTTILESIVANKYREVKKAKNERNISFLERSIYFNRVANSLVKNLTTPNMAGIIAEHKRKSPSKGIINDKLSVQEITNGYTAAKASGLSVLTDFSFFGGTKEDLIISRISNPDIPILRKDFIIDDYQIIEAKAWGADVILLIAACLSPKQITSLSRTAQNVGLEVLLEVHNQAELEGSPLDSVNMIGVNNRNLKNFSENNINASIELAEKIPASKIKISESCISDVSAVRYLKSIGYNGFLMGETFMRTEQPAQALKKFIDEI